jgi:hypothetical protein
MPVSSKLRSVLRCRALPLKQKIIIKIVKLLDVCALSYCFERKNALLLRQLTREAAAFAGVIAIIAADVDKLPDDKIVTKTHSC